jgi:hypothetical protein
MTYDWMKGLVRKNITSAGVAAVGHLAKPALAMAWELLPTLGQAVSGLTIVAGVAGAALHISKVATDKEAFNLDKQASIQQKINELENKITQIEKQLANHVRKSDKHKYREQLKNTEAELHIAKKEYNDHESHFITKGTASFYKYVSAKVNGAVDHISQLDTLGKVQLTAQVVSKIPLIIPTPYKTVLKAVGGDLTGAMADTAAHGIMGSVKDIGSVVIKACLKTTTKDLGGLPLQALERGNANELQSQTSLTK